MLTGDLNLIDKGELGILKKDISEIERILKALIKSIENKQLNPGPLACPVIFFGEKERNEFNWGILESLYFLFVFFRRLEFKFKN